MTSTLHTARPTTYRGIPMRSRLEASWAAAFDNHNLPWEYEPRAFADQTGQYLPDFHLSTRGLWVEVKPAHWAAKIAASCRPEIGVSNDPLLRRMAIIWSSTPTDRLVVLCGLPDEAGAWRSDTEHHWWWTSKADYIWTPDPAAPA